jgi:hypothetical protein
MAKLAVLMREGGWVGSAADFPFSASRERPAAFQQDARPPAVRVGRVPGTRRVTMNLLSSCLLLTGLAVGSLDAQSPPLWVPPGLSFDGHNDFWDFRTNPAFQGLSTHPSRPIYAISAQKLPSDPAGQWTVCITVRALQNHGGGYSGFVLAKWNPTSATPLVITNEADPINDFYVDYNLNLDPTGRYGVFDRFNLLPGNVLEHVGVFLATRPDDRTPFGAPVLVSGIQGTQNWADPALGYVGGQLKLFYSAVADNGSNQMVAGILMDDLVDVNTGTPHVAGSPVMVAQPLDRQSQPPRYCHSPQPIHGGDGDVEGMFLAEGEGPAGLSVSLIYFAADLDPATPYVEALSSSRWMTSGGMAGGTLLFSDTVDSFAARVAEGAWLVGDETTVGGTADVTMTAYSEPGQPTAFATVFFSTVWLPRAVTLPIAFGELAIPYMGRVGRGMVPDADQRIDFRFSVPRHRALHGQSLAIQGLAQRCSARDGFVNTFTNSAVIRIR